MRLSRSARIFTALMACLATGSAFADPGESHRMIPKGHMPPPGECRNWIPGVPPGQQPPPTDCYTAYEDTYYNGGWLVYGDEKDRRDERRW